MSNLFASLRSSANALGVYQRGLEVAQNNIGNANTPGYSRTRLSLTALPFNPVSGLMGGVAAGPIQDSRDAQAERGVWQQSAAVGWSDAQANTLNAIEAVLPVTDGSGIAGALSGFIQAASNWSMAPSDSAARQNVIEAARDVGLSFRHAADGATDALHQTDSNVQSTVQTMNALSAEIASINGKLRQSPQADEGLQAQLYAALEDLSQSADITVMPQDSGSVMVLLPGGSPLVMGDQHYDLQAVPPQGNGDLRVVSQGQDVTAQLTGGALGGMVQARNSASHLLLGTDTDPGGLNSLAQAFADRVNGILRQGQGADPNLSLFVYDAAGPAHSLDVNPDLQAADLPAVMPGAAPTDPGVANGVALSLASIGDGTDPQDRVNGYSFTQYYGQLTAGIGRDLAQAKQDQESGTQLLAQARNLRTATSGVSLDEEAVTLMEFQRSYEAAAKVITTLDEMTQTILGLI